MDYQFIKQQFKDSKPFLLKKNFIVASDQYIYARNSNRNYPGV